MTTSPTCPTGCGRTLQVGKLMCSLCWYEVPQDLQRQVTLTWAKHRKLMRTQGRTPDQVRVSRAAYEHAKDAAIASIA